MVVLVQITSIEKITTKSVICMNLHMVQDLILQSHGDPSEPINFRNISDQAELRLFIFW